MFGVSFRARELGLPGQNGDGAIERGLLMTFKLRSARDFDRGHVQYPLKEITVSSGCDLGNHLRMLAATKHVAHTLDQPRELLRRLQELTKTCRS